MLDIEKYRKQVDRLNDCLKNLESAIKFEREVFEKKLGYDSEESSNELVEICEQTLIGQLKLMNIQNKEDLES